MNKITLKEIRDLDPCYDPSLHMKEDWEGTLVDFLQIDVIPNHDRIWVAVRLAPRTLVEIFAIDCAFAAHDAAYDAAYDADDAYDAYSADTAAALAAHAAAAYAAHAAHDADDAYAADTAAYAAHAYAAHAAHDAADAVAYAAHDAARNQQRENQIDALIMLLEQE